MVLELITFTQMVLAPSRKAISDSIQLQQGSELEVYNLSAMHKGGGIYQSRVSRYHDGSHVLDLRKA